MDKVILFNVIDNDPVLENHIQKDLKDLMGYQDYRIIAVNSKNGFYTLVCFLNLDEIGPLTNIFKRYDMLIDTSDITNEIIMGKIPDSWNGALDFVTYRKILNDFRIKNTKVDHVLDMISESGIGSLEKFQMEILDNFKD